MLNPSHIYTLAEAAKPTVAEQQKSQQQPVAPNQDLFDLLGGTQQQQPQIPLQQVQPGMMPGHPSQ